MHTGRFYLFLFPRHTSLKFAFFLGAILYAVLTVGFSSLLLLLASTNFHSFNYN